MKRARTPSTSRTPIQAQNVVRALCESIDAATRGNMAQAHSKIRGAVTIGAKLLATGAIDSRGALLISTAAANANRKTHARAPVPVSAREPVCNNRRTNPMTSLALLPDRVRSAEDERFEALLGLLIGEQEHR